MLTLGQHTIYFCNDVVYPSAQVKYVEEIEEWCGLYLYYVILYSVIVFNLIIERHTIMIFGLFHMGEEGGISYMNFFSYYGVLML